jgi:hypothetical protein
MNPTSFFLIGKFCLSTGEMDSPVYTHAYAHDEPYFFFSNWWISSEYLINPFHLVQPWEIHLTHFYLVFIRTTDDWVTLPGLFIWSGVHSELKTPSLSVMMKIILRVHSVAQVIMRHNQCSQPLLCTSFIVETAPTVIIITLNDLSTSATIAYSMLLCTKYLSARFIEATDFNSSGG